MSFPPRVNIFSGNPLIGAPPIILTKKLDLFQRLDPRSKFLRMAGMTFIVFSLWSIVYSLWSSPSWAGGPISITSDGEPSTWESPITLHPEGGTCGAFSNSQMIDKLEEALEYWTTISGIDLTINIETGTIDEDVNDGNYTDYYVGYDADGILYVDGLQDNINPVIFDDDGSITDAINGSGSRFGVLGFAGPDGYEDSSLVTIVDGQAFFNCRCLAGSPSGDCPPAGNPVVFTEDDLTFTMTHEIGHMLGVDHSQINQAVIPLTASRQFNCDLDVAGDCLGVSLMFPVSVDAGDQLPPIRDDEVAMLTLYGRGGLEDNFVTVTGSLIDADGLPLRCADVQAETDDPTDAIAVVSGIFAENVDLDGDAQTDANGECLENCGDFILRGLDPDKNYTITVRPLDPAWTGGSGIYPCDPQLTTIEEEQIDSFSAGAVAGGSVRNLENVETISTGGVVEPEDDNDDDDDSVATGCALSANMGSFDINYLLFLVFTGMIIVLRHARTRNVIPAPRNFL